MAEFRLPELGENITTAAVSRVLVQVGDTIARDQSVVELDTDKATVEVPSTIDGRVTAVLVKPGDAVQVGTAIIAVESIGDGPAAVSAPTTPAAPPPPLLKVVDIAQGKPRAPEPAPEPVVLAASQRDLPLPATDRGVPAAASPAVRRIAREIGVDVDAVRGTGPDGRITQDDVKGHARRVLTSVGMAARGETTAASGGSAASDARPLPDFTRWGPVERQPMSPVRRATAEHLTHAWNVIPHVTQVDKADVTELEALRKANSKAVEAAGGKLTMTAILVRVLAGAVKAFPQFNASIDRTTEEIILKKYVHVGVAVDTDRGLLVPVIRDVDRKTLTQIAVEVQEAAAKARDRKLSRDEMSGGGISLSNLGGIGGTSFTPIVNWPEVAILGVSRGATEPVYRSGTFEPRLMLPLSLSYDHRVIDGADAIRFLRWIVQVLEEPFRLSLMGV